MKQKLTLIFIGILIASIAGAGIYFNYKRTQKIKALNAYLGSLIQLGVLPTGTQINEAFKKQAEKAAANTPSTDLK